MKKKGKQKIFVNPSWVHCTQNGLQEIAHGFMLVQEQEWIRDIFFS
jgi:hypothetical protein